MSFKTPGVYVQEIATFPPSVVAVETAIPAFIGYTAKAVNEAGASLRFVPTRIKSLLDFETQFGGDFTPSSYDVQVDVPNGSAIGTVTPRDAANNGRRYYMYASLRQFYAMCGTSSCRPRRLSPTTA